MDLVPAIVTPLTQVGELANYAAWKRARLAGAGKPFFPFRERLWEALLPDLRAKGSMTVLEFGVAWGYATRWWLSRLPDPAIEWHGFDTFTGLPTSWDRAGLVAYDAGSFSAQGAHPPIDDDRVHWHVGDVATSIGEVDLQSRGARPLFVFLDFDMYVPTAIALGAVIPHLEPGDVLYFDEAFDAWNERKVIDEALLPKRTVRCLGSTATALALEITGKLHA
jgi:hypothetical protein